MPGGKSGNPYLPERPVTERGAMSAQDTGPAYVISLIAGALIIIGGLVRAASTGVIPTRAYGTGFKIASTTLRAANLNVTNTFLQLSAMVGVITGIIVLVGAVMLSSQSHQNATWGTVILVFSAFSLIGGGGFFIGSILGIFGGIIAITWRPTSPATH